MMQALRPRDSHRGNLGGYQLQDEDDDSQQVTSSALQGISRTAATQQQRFFHMPRFQTNFQKQQNYFNVQQFKQHLQQMQGIEFDGKRLRKAVARKTVDYNSSILQAVEARVWQRDFRDRRAVQPDVGYYTELIPPVSMIENPINAVTTKFVRTSTNKMRCPIFCVAWTPEGRRLVTGASSGEFTLWNGLTFNFETILQAHDSPVRCMMWSHSDVWMVTGDHAGYVKYWQSNMNNVKMFQAHKEPLRGISFCPMDTKFATCSDDGTVRIWDFLRCHEEKILRGHGADVKCLDWHPQKALIVSGSKDSQQPIKLWDPKMGQSLATLHAHKNTVTEVKWNKNGNWLLTGSRDHLLKLFDIRNMSQEVQTFRGHKKEAISLAWHPVHESLFVSGGSEGSIMFWVVGADKEVGGMEQAHDSCVWSLAWHPLGHILCSGSNDHTSKFWTRNRPGDRMRDKYNLNTLPRGQDEAAEYDEPSSISTIPGMGLEHGLPEHLRPAEQEPEEDTPTIPGLDFGTEELSHSEKQQQQQQQRKIPHTKPIPKHFQQQWMENKQPLLLAPPTDDVDELADTSQIQTSELGNTVYPPPTSTPPVGPPSQHQIMPPPGGSPSRGRIISFNPRFPSPLGGQGHWPPHPFHPNSQKPRGPLLGPRPGVPPRPLLQTPLRPHLKPPNMPEPSSQMENPLSAQDIRSQNMDDRKSHDTDQNFRDLDHRQLPPPSHVIPQNTEGGEWKSYDEHLDQDMRSLQDRDLRNRDVDDRGFVNPRTPSNPQDPWGHQGSGNYFEEADHDERHNFPPPHILREQRGRIARGCSPRKDGAPYHPSTNLIYQEEDCDMRFAPKDSDMRQSSDVDERLPTSSDSSYPLVHKRSWHDGPGEENGSYPPEHHLGGPPLPSLRGGRGGFPPRGGLRGGRMLMPRGVPRGQGPFRGPRSRGVMQGNFQ
ncbi:pre-mRNA 3' end processing protein WDR33-like [Limulus polyphemus]|uniref:Pre-mRNA 3' end processing protein WDR33-like n=1 Tax=Limulus polyphemus TaxID=6850 RepID=A0ABM1B8Q6_LIMPO|nr:pre-mRNA 3' end processing protein WDR33-like [Limulus polyphemus]XP_022244558.1 pre-mRNA 3' end processing protein WDR33-like [Limulus polyphemus]XP_022244559.1 pre-mRNA 3' end processing protein WDR33-like [Limulus polyphemus]XP_022244560.1 pre-mRNA 3' end processing protein WDR33-like [Limulus polyphemus]